MNNNKQLQIEVFAHWYELGKPVLVGVLCATPSRGKEIFSFEYDNAWLSSSSAQKIDPALHLYKGHQYVDSNQINFGVFLDSAPDRWGRFLMKRRESQLAREEKRDERKLYESDYLLGVYDEHRLGALRFRTDPNGPFLDNNKSFASPPWTSLRELEQASIEIEKENAESNPDYSKWLNMLIAPGGSLGGARPKASVTDEHNHLWIAKFPSGGDHFNIGAWEMVAYKLASRVGIIMPDAKIAKYNSRHHTFLSKRFDRIGKNKRIHFVSAMTLLQKSDGDDATQEVSYLDLAEIIIQYGNQVEQDLEQLWRRIVFHICISNTDDHLRNHGFLLNAEGWSLSPAFDINPIPDGNGLKLNISEADNAQDLELAKEVSQYFRVTSKRADEIIKEVIKVTKDWRKEANALGISLEEQNRFTRAFRIVDQYK